MRCQTDLRGSKTIQLSARDVQDFKRLFTLLETDGISGTTRSNIADMTVPQLPRRMLLKDRARNVLSRRRRRYAIFGRAMFGEPAWEILLLLYVSSPSARQTITRLADLAGASKSTALRWIDYLEGQRLVVREVHPTDKRANFVELTDKGREAIEVYLSDTAEE